MTLTATESLSTLLRDGSKAEHTSAEGSSFMSVMLEGRISPEGYTAYLLRLQRVYAALESVARRLADDPIASAVIDPALERSVSLAADLDHWAGAGWREIVVESPATERYVERVEASASWGGLFVAHHYTRYLGDLSGGQAIGRILGRAYELETTAGVEFYAFDEIPKPKPYKDAYRARLDALSLDSAEQQRILDEVKVVFGLNEAIFSELSADLDRWSR
ncbi:heme oxygenase (biliverdin-producing) [Aeromicrobium piscarium]|uniref:Biliverdin-producing heme oxygenase n=1 Tax=Aeromicrobium piscarium TaxID=2590901 RepID=A0A554SB45_9ACTN|nr:biliverdin-producing heme oxygenase [Aeromicrobium piscarium]TSD63568.1 biliverdin-producing heme oxygenase [Aeromicrobium piscarium]